MLNFDWLCSTKGVGWNTKFPTDYTSTSSWGTRLILIAAVQRRTAVRFPVTVRSQLPKSRVDLRVTDFGHFSFCSGAHVVIPNGSQSLSCLAEVLVLEERVF